MSTPDFTHDILITFGDCDPAGIVFYPNYFRFLDRTFHAWLMTHGGHKAVCAKAGARGIGLVDASAKFRAPLEPGDTVTVALRATHWGARSFTLSYELTRQTRIHATATEVRTVFVDTPNGIASGNTRTLEQLLSSGPG